MLASAPPPPAPTVARCLPVQGTFDELGTPLRETTFVVVGKNLIGSIGPQQGFAGIDYPLAPRTLMFLINQQL